MNDRNEALIKRIDEMIAPYMPNQPLKPGSFPELLYDCRAALTASSEPVAPDKLEAAIQWAEKEAWLLDGKPAGAHLRVLIDAAKDAERCRDKLDALLRVSHDQRPAS